MKSSVLMFPVALLACTASLSFMFRQELSISPQITSQSLTDSAAGLPSPSPFPCPHLIPAATDPDYLKRFFADLAAQPCDGSVISFHAAGDIMLDRDTRHLIEKSGVTAPWAQLGDLLDGVDLTFANLEGTVNEQPSSYTFDPPFRFVFAPDAVAEVKKYFDAVSLANNHAHDVVGADAETHMWLAQLGLPWFGNFSTPEHTFTKDGVTLIGYHAFSPNVAALEQTIRDAKAAGNFVIVFPHWGIEYQHTPDNNQTYLAQIMHDAGADLVLGGHPHVWESLDEIGHTPVLYSLGNFIFDQKIPDTYDALTVGGIITPTDVTLYLLPVYTKSSTPRPLTDAEAQILFSKIAAVSHPSLSDQVKTGIITFTR